MRTRSHPAFFEGEVRNDNLCIFKSIGFLSVHVVYIAVRIAISNNTTNRFNQEKIIVDSESVNVIKAEKETSWAQLHT